MPPDGIAQDKDARTRRPLIGILTEPGDGMYGKSGLKADHPQMSNIVSSYVKFVETGGARAVPLMCNEPEDSLRRKFLAINGIIFPGGGLNFKGKFGALYLETSTRLFNWAVEANDKGDYFPIFGICFGLELLSIIVSGRFMLDDSPAKAITSPVYFVDDAAKTKSIFKWIPKDVLDQLDTTEPLAFQNHRRGVKPETFNSIPSLVDFFEVLTVTPDANGDLYISSMQGRRYPVTAVMFHPEKNAFEWNWDTIPHSENAIRLTQSIANYVVSEARRSSHAPASKAEEEDFLVNQFPLVYVGNKPTAPCKEFYYFW